MKTKLKMFAISFILMIISYLSVYFLDLFLEIGLFAPHIGLLFILGLLFGPYGALGAVTANVFMDYYSGFSIPDILPSALVSFGVSYLAYKIWYSSFRDYEITKPRLDNIYHISLFLADLFICGFIYAVFHSVVFNLISDTNQIFLGVLYFFNFINIGFIFGIISIMISKKIDLALIPKKSKRKPRVRLYKALFCLILLLIITLAILPYSAPNEIIVMIGLILFLIVLFAFLTKPFTHEISQKEKDTILEKIINYFLIITLIIAIIGVILNLLYSGELFLSSSFNEISNTLGPLILTDIIIIFCFIPGFFTVRYVEKKVTNPISSFSEIEEFIKEDERIEAEGLLNIYSEYIGEKDEIGMLARSYTQLINHNNNYIENIHEIESEKERIEAELDIATKIQASTLPTESIETDEYVVNGYSHPAREVGGDFFDYYQLDDENLALVIGDASGKGVPAALLSTITQAIIKQLLQHDTDPSKILYSLNNQLYENNSQTMFITLWLGIYNKHTKKITFSNAGHNPPLIKVNEEFQYLDMESGIVLGIIEDFEFVNEEMDFQGELILYTDGITDANNHADEMYGEQRLLEFFNEFKNDSDPIDPLLENIQEFTKGSEQYDDMTLIYLKDKTK